MKELNQLEVWKLRSGMHWQEIASKIGIEVSSLKDIREKRSPNVKVKTCTNIFLLTGLAPWDYLNFSEEDKAKVINKIKSIWDYKLKN